MKYTVNLANLYPTGKSIFKLTAERELGFIAIKVESIEYFSKNPTELYPATGET